MPRSYADIPDAYTGIIRPVIYHVSRRILTELRLPADTKVFIPGENGYVPLPQSVIDECCSKETVFPQSTKLVLNFSEEPALQSALATATSTENTPPFFADTERDIYITPIRRQVKVTCTFEFTGQSIIETQRLTDFIKHRISMRWSDFPFDLQYSYLIPDNLILLLMSLHKTMEASSAPTGKSFGEYFEAYRASPSLKLTTMIGTAPRIAITEHQYEVMGAFDFNDAPPAAQRSGNENGSFVTSMSFSFYYSRPVQFLATWPLLVHNRVIDTPYRPNERYRAFGAVTRKVSTFKAAMDSLNKLKDRLVPPYLNIPHIDDFSPKTDDPSYQFLFQLMVAIEGKEENETLFNFNDLGKHFRIGSDLAEYINQLGTLAFSSSAILHLELHENNRRVPFHFTVENGAVVCSEKLDPTKYYHLRFGVRRNWKFVNESHINGLRRYPNLFKQLTQFLRIPTGSRKQSDYQVNGYGHPRLPNPRFPGEGFGRGKDTAGTLTRKELERAIIETSSRQPRGVRDGTTGPRFAFHIGILVMRSSEIPDTIEGSTYGTS